MAYIEKEPIIDFIVKGLNNPDKTKAFGHDAIEILSEIHFAPAVEIKHGYWAVNEQDTFWGNSIKRRYCSECKTEAKFNSETGNFYLSKYCPECGAKML